MSVLCFIIVDRLSDKHDGKQLQAPIAGCLQHKHIHKIKLWLKTIVMGTFGFIQQ